MSKIQVLDCTLRDGGYCNNCRFGFDNEKKIVHGLVEANIDIIECGFLMNTVEYDKDVTKFTSLDEVAKIRTAEKLFEQYSIEQFKENHKAVKELVNRVVEQMQ